MTDQLQQQADQLEKQVAELVKFTDQVIAEMNSDMKRYGILTPVKSETGVLEAKETGSKRFLILSPTKQSDLISQNGFCLNPNTKPNGGTP